MTQTIETQLGPGPGVENGQPWRSKLAPIGVATDDGRIFDELTWRDLPLSLLWQPENQPGHDGAVVVGRIDRIEQQGEWLWGFGVLDEASPDGREATRQIRERFLRGVSIDASVLEVTEGADGLMHFRGKIGAATIVAFPAFADAEIELVDPAEQPAPSEAASMVWPVSEPRAAAGDFGAGLSLLAAARPQGPPAAWFADPQLSRREPLHVGEDGRVWGHLCGWGECHIGDARRCVQPPQSAHAYAYFRTGHVLCADGTQVATGPIVLSADHAALRASWLVAKDHYAHSALAVADVACGEDSHGIWVAGAVRPGATAEQVHALRASAPSGDWRPIGGALELVAILSVNTPGFPALSASFDGTELVALVASGGATHGEDCGCGSGELAGRITALEADLERLTRPEREARLRSLDGAVAAARLARLDRLV